MASQIFSLVWVATRAVLMVLYFTFLAPLGLLVRWSLDPLDARVPAARWHERRRQAETLESGGRQY
jgi:hypothetical protein